MRDLLAQTQRAYVLLARGVGAAAARRGSSPDVPSRDRRIRHWLASLPRIHDSLAIAELDVPWWTYRAIDIVDAWLAARPRVRAFEYGAGASTLWLASRSDEVVSVEHDAGFARIIGPSVDKLDNARLIVVEPTPSAHPAVGSAKPGNEHLDFSGYVAAIDQAGGVFDLIVVDGRARTACLSAAISHLAEDGMIVFDNSARRRYRAAIEASDLIERRLRGLTPTLPYPNQTSLLQPVKGARDPAS